MAQYTILSGSSIELSDGTDTFRVIEEGGSVLRFDQTKTSLGFDGVENTDWQTIDTAELPGGAGGNQFRVGVRDTYWVIDQVYTPIVLGFSGTEGEDWDLVERHQL